MRGDENEDPQRPDPEREEQASRSDLVDEPVDPEAARSSDHDDDPWAARLATRGIAAPVSLWL